MIRFIGYYPALAPLRRPVPHSDTRRDREVRQIQLFLDPVKGCVADQALASHFQQLLPSCRKHLGAEHLYRKGWTSIALMR